MARKIGRRGFDWRRGRNLRCLSRMQVSGGERGERLSIAGASPLGTQLPTMSMPSRKKIRGLTAGSRSCRRRETSGMPGQRTRAVRLVPRRQELRGRRARRRVFRRPPVFSSRRGCEQIFESPLNSWPLYTILTIGETRRASINQNRGIPSSSPHIHPDTSMAVDILRFYHLPGVRRARLFQVEGGASDKAELPHARQERWRRSARNMRLKAALGMAGCWR